MVVVPCSVVRLHSQWTNCSMPIQDNIPLSLGSVHVFYCVFFSIGGNCRLVIATSVKTWLPILDYSSFKSICCSLKTFISLYYIYELIQH